MNEKHEAFGFDWVEVPHEEFVEYLTKVGCIESPLTSDYITVLDKNNKALYLKKIN